MSEESLSHDEAFSSSRVREKLARPHGEEQETRLREEAAVMVPRVPVPRVLALLVVHRGGHFRLPCLSQTRAPRSPSACGRLAFLLLLSLQGWQRLPPSIASRTRLRQHTPVTAPALASRQQGARSPPPLLAQRARGKVQRRATNLRQRPVCSHSPIGARAQGTPVSVWRHARTPVCLHAYCLRMHAQRKACREKKNADAPAQTQRHSSKGTALSRDCRDLGCAGVGKDPITACESEACECGTMGGGRV